MSIEPSELTGMILHPVNSIDCSQDQGFVADAHIELQSLVRTLQMIVQTKSRTIANSMAKFISRTRRKTSCWSSFAKITPFVLDCLVFFCNCFESSSRALAHPKGSVLRQIENQIEKVAYRPNPSRRFCISGGRFGRPLRIFSKKVNLSESFSNSSRFSENC